MRSACIALAALLILTLLPAAAQAHQSLRDRQAGHILGLEGSFGIAVPIDPDFKQLTTGIPMISGAGLIYMPAPFLETRLEFMHRRSASGSDSERAALLEIYGGSIGAGYVAEPWILKIDVGIAVTFSEARMKIRDELIEYSSSTFSNGFQARVGLGFEIDAGPLLICPGINAKYDHIPTEEFYILKQLGGVGFGLQLQILLPIRQERKVEQ